MDKRQNSILTSFDFNLMKFLNINSYLDYNKLLGFKKITPLEQDAVISLLELKKELPFITKSRYYLLNKSINSLKKHSLISKYNKKDRKQRIRSSIFNIIKTKNKNEIIYCIGSLRSHQTNLKQENCIEGLINLLKTQLN
jgi:hypothetical protein